MQVKAEQLISQHKKSPLPVIWISGDESLLVQESCDEVRKYAKANGYLEREVLDVTPSFDWNLLLSSANSLSLFAERKLIDLRLNSSKLDNEAKKALHAYCENPGEDNLLLITSGKIEKASTKAKWFQNIEKQACFVQIWPINAQQLPQWIQRRLKQRGFTADPEAISLLCNRVEGNLLAADQEIEKLSMLTDETHLDPGVINAAVADSSRFSVFNLIDSTLLGHSPKALNILNHLKAEGTEPLQLVNLFCREIRVLINMREKIEEGQYPGAVMKEARIWSNRTQIIGTALENHTVKSLQRILNDAKTIDQSVKGFAHNNPWDEIIQLILNLANTPSPLN